VQSINCIPDSKFKFELPEDVILNFSPTMNISGKKKGNCRVATAEQIISGNDSDLTMTKRFYTAKINNPLGSRVTDGFWLGLVDFASVGVKHYDLAGYPHEDIPNGLMSDWYSIGNDMNNAIKTVKKK